MCCSDLFRKSSFISLKLFCDVWQIEGRGQKACPWGWGSCCWEERSAEHNIQGREVASDPGSFSGRQPERNPDLGKWSGRGWLGHTQEQALLQEPEKWPYQGELAESTARAQARKAAEFYIWQEWSSISNLEELTYS